MPWLVYDDVSVQDNPGCLDNAKAKAASFLSSEVNNIDRSEVFHMAITAYALSLTLDQSKLAYDELWKLVRNDCKLKDLFFTL